MKTAKESDIVKYCVVVSTAFLDEIRRPDSVLFIYIWLFTVNVTERKFAQGRCRLLPKPGH